MLVIVDTLAKGINAGGGDNENTAKDKGAALANLHKVLDLIPDIHIAVVGDTWGDEEKALEVRTRISPTSTSRSRSAAKARSEPRPSPKPTTARKARSSASAACCTASEPMTWRPGRRPGFIAELAKRFNLTEEEAGAALKKAKRSTQPAKPLNWHQVQPTVTA